jgi:hypothetical protein
MTRQFPTRLKTNSKIVADEVHDRENLIFFHAVLQ